MNTMSEIEQAVRYLSQGQQRLLLDWLTGELNLEMGVSEPTARYGSAAEAREFFTLEEYFEMEEEFIRRSDGFNSSASGMTSSTGPTFVRRAARRGTRKGTTSTSPAL
jgi:hypothetical protein